MKCNSVYIKWTCYRDENVCNKPLRCSGKQCFVNNRSWVLPPSFSSLSNVTFGFPVKDLILPEIRPRGYKKFFMLISADSKIYPADLNVKLVI